MSRSRIKVGDVEMELPPGVEALGEDDLFSVPFDLLNIATNEADGTGDYRWVNPRHLGQSDNSMGHGFDKPEMEELYNDIKDDGLMCPLICRWVIVEESLRIQVLDGERRWRSINRQIEKNERVWSRKDQQWLPAKNVHSKIPCRVIAGNDKEALKVAFMVSDRSVAWGEGATAKLIKKLRDCKCSDKEILELTKKSTQWLKEQDDICDLDDLTFSYLIDGKINRALALRLSKIENVERRQYWLHASYDDAVATHQEELSKADGALAKAEQKEELADAVLAEARESGDQEAIAEAKETLEEMQEKTQLRRRQRSEASRPRAKNKNLRNAAAKVGRDEDDDEVAQPLRPGRIRKEVEILNKLIKDGGKDADNKPVADVALLEALRYCYEHNVLGGEEDISKVLKRYKSFSILQQRQAAKIEAKTEASLEDDLEDDLEDEQ